MHANVSVSTPMLVLFMPWWVAGLELSDRTLRKQLKVEGASVLTTKEGFTIQILLYAHFSPTSLTFASIAFLLTLYCFNSWNMLSMSHVRFPVCNWLILSRSSGIKKSGIEVFGGSRGAFRFIAVTVTRFSAVEGC